MTLLLPELLSAQFSELNDGQRKAMRHLAGSENVFVTGGAGTGKSFLLRKFLQGVNSNKIPILASTGAAAVLIGGRTFHSFFGLGIMEAGPLATIERAIGDRRVRKRLKQIKGFVLDEVSMIPGAALETAERIASLVRDDVRPWGGLQVIAVGDFAQLPPVTLHSQKRDWAFLNPVWEKSTFSSIHLTEMMRAKEDHEFCEILGDVRVGLVSDRVKNMLEWRTLQSPNEEFEASVLYPKKVDVDRVNLSKLATLAGEATVFETEYSGDERFRKNIMAHAPVTARLELKKGAFVMLRQNDPKSRFVNGSLGHVQHIEKDSLEIQLLNGKIVDIERARFSMLDAQGEEVAAARNFPVNLAYAVTIHKAQGATLDRAIVSLKNLWEPGQAYVALSRLRSSESLLVNGWDERSIFADPQVTEFHASILSAIH